MKPRTRLLAVLLAGFVVLSSFATRAWAEEGKLTAKRILELWKQPDDRSVIPKGFKRWAVASEYEARISIKLPDSEKEEVETLKVPEKLVGGKYLIFHISHPGSPVEFYGVQWYEPKTDAYRKTVCVKGKAGGEAEGFAGVVHFIGIRYPGTDLYAFTQTEGGPPNEKTVSIERHTPEKSEWKTVTYDEDGKVLRTQRGQAIPVKSPKRAPPVKD